MMGYCNIGTKIPVTATPWYRIPVPGVHVYALQALYAHALRCTCTLYTGTIYMVHVYVVVQCYRNCRQHATGTEQDLQSLKESSCQNKKMVHLLLFNHLCFFASEDTNNTIFRGDSSSWFQIWPCGANACGLLDQTILSSCHEIELRCCVFNVPPHRYSVQFFWQ